MCITMSPLGERTKVRTHWPLARALSPMNRVGVSERCASLVAQTSSLLYRRHLACRSSKAGDPWHCRKPGRLEVGDTAGWETCATVPRFMGSRDAIFSAYWDHEPVCSTDFSRLFARIPPKG